jgi:hypothetical protein
MVLLTQEQNRSLLNGEASLAELSPGLTLEPRVSPGLTLEQGTPTGSVSTQQFPMLSPPPQQTQATQQKAPEREPQAFQPTDLLGRTQTLQERVGQLGQQFQQQAGPALQFGEEQQQSLLGALSGGATPEQLQLAQGVLGTQFTGPTQLNQQEVGDIQSRIQSLSGIGRGLASGTGLTGFLQQQTPGLTSGQALFEAERRQGELRGLGAETQRGAGEAQRALTGQQELAQQTVEQRRQQAEQVREQARGFLGGQREELTAGVEERIAAQQEAQQAVAGAFQKFQESGDIKDLEGFVPEDQLAPFKERGERLQKAKEARTNLDKEFDDIKDIPIEDVGLVITKRGRANRTVKIGDKTFQLNRSIAGRDEPFPGMTREETRKAAQRILDRQKEAEKLFGTELTKRGFTGEDRGEFADVAPLFGQQQEPIDLRQFAQFAGGITPSFGQTAGAGEIEQLNRIAQLLGESGRLQDLPAFQAAQIGIAPELFEEAVAQRASQNLAGQEGFEERFGETVRGQRRKVRKAKKKRRVATTVGAGLGLSPPLIALAQNIKPDTGRIEFQ